MYLDSRSIAATTRMWREFDYAKEKHPSWDGKSVVEITALVTEEAGEAMREANNYMELIEQGTAWYGPAQVKLDDLRTELAQTAAVALRALIYLEKEQ